MFSPTSRGYDLMSPRFSLAPVPRYQEQKIAAARWKEWEPWVWLHLRHQGYAPAGSPELARLRQRHSEHIVGLMQRGVTMRLIRRHQLDDPRITDELRMVLMQAAIGRCKRARLARHPSSLDSTTQLHATGDSQQGSESSKIDLASRDSFPIQSTPVAIDMIQKLVSEHFRLHELRVPNLKVRSKRQIIALPRQLAMYIVRQLTTASLPQIGRQFGGMHHTTVLHSINKIQGMRRSDEDLDRAITRLMDALQKR
jgi:DnaA-like protein